MMADNKESKKIDNSVILGRIEETIQKIKDKKETFYFFTIDSRGIPNGSVSYIYQFAKSLMDRGYNVCMAYQLENEYSEEELDKLNRKKKPIDQNRVFQGVGSWLGEEYDKIPRINIMKEQWKVAPSDFLFIPEVFSGMMFQSMKAHVPCKRYILLQNYDYVTKFIPMGVSWANYGIMDAIATTKEQVDRIHTVFPFVKAKILPPYIPDYFRKPVTAKKLIVNLCVQNQDDVNRIIKPFYWKYPIYKFISFRDLRNFPRKQYADMLKEGAITIWVDRDTSFGYQPVEAMKCGSIVIGKVPEKAPEWMVDKDGKMSEAGIWFDDIDDVHKILAAVIGAWMSDTGLEDINEKMDKEASKLYTKEEWDKNITDVIKYIEDSRFKELEEVKNIAREKAAKDKEEDK